MRVVVVSTLAGAAWGGSEVLWAATASRLAAGGSSVVAVTRDRRPRPPALDDLAADGVELRTWRPAGRPARAMYKVGVAHGPAPVGDVLLVNMASAHDLVTAVAPRAAVRRARRDGTPYALAPHSLVERGMPDRNRALLRELYAGAAAVVVPAAGMQADLERQLVVRLPACVEIPTPTPLLTAPPEPWPGAGTLRLACVARLDVEQKGHDALLAALADVSWRDDDWTLDLYGSGPDEAYVRALVAFYGLGDHVRLRGHTDDVAAVWRDHHALVLPSRREARGIAITEAMAAGRPVLGTAIGGIPDSVVDGVTGILAPSPTPAGLRIGLERFWSARDDLEGWGRAGRVHVLRAFTPDPVDRLVGVLRAATERPAN